MRPIAGYEPVGLDFLDPVAGAQPGQDTCVTRRKRDELGIALDRDAAPCDVLFENPLGLVLRHSQNERIAAVDRIQAYLRDRAAVAIDADRFDALALRQKTVYDLHQLEGLEGPRVDRDRSRFHRAVRRFVDDTAFDPVARHGS
jgi:hypothetical protein